MLLGLSAFLVLTIVWDRAVLHGGRDFWDARVYARALVSQAAGQNPYAFNGNLPFVYPPIFLYVAGLLHATVPAPLLDLLYLGAVSLSCVAIPLLLARRYLRATWMTPGLALVLFALQPRLFGELLLLSGNLAAPMYAAVLATGLRGLRCNAWGYLYVAVIVCALLKPPFLLFLLLPLFAGSRQWLKSGVAVLATGIGTLLQRLLVPDAFRAFQQSIYEQIVVRQDAGFTVYGLALGASHRLPALKGAGAMALHGLVAGLLFAGVLLVQRRARYGAMRQLWAPLLLVIAIVANPRMSGYDSAIAVVPALFLSVECARALPATPLRALWVGLPVMSFVVLLSRAPLVALCVFFLASSFAALATIYFRARAGAYVPEELVETEFAAA